MVEYESIKTTISAAIIKIFLMRGLFFAFIGIIGMTLSGAFLPIPLLKNWGFLIYVGCMGLIIWGLLPYKKIAQLQLKPNKLRLNSQLEIQFFSKGLNIISIPANSIQEIKYYKNAMNYGILIWFKKPLTEKVILHHQENKEVHSLRKQGYKMAHADLFIPWFNERSVNKIIEWLKIHQQTSVNDDYKPV